MKKKLPNVQQPLSGLFNLPYEAVKWEILKTAIVLDLFVHLTESKTAKEISDTIETHPENTEYLLNALTAMGCLKKTSGRFQNTDISQSFLTKERDTSIGEFLLYMDSWNTSILNGGLCELVKKGPCPPPDMTDEKIWEHGARLATNHSRVGRAQLLSNIVADLPEFTSFNKMLDLGSGSGILGIAIAAKHPSMSCVLFDQTAVTKVADEVIDEYGMNKRVSTLSGNYLKDNIGHGYDFIMANFTLNFYKDHLNLIFDKVFEALNPGGIFMVTSDGITNEKTQPPGTIISWLSTSLQGMDMSFEQGVIADTMLNTGFRSVRSKTLLDKRLEAHGPVDMDIARK